MLDKLYMLNCFKCCIKFEDKYDKYSICFICRKSFCIECYEKHKHNNVESQFETLQDIIKEKTNTLYKPLSKYNWNECLEIYQDSIRERMTIICICRQRYDFIGFHRQLVNIKERFNYLFIEMIFKKLFCCDICNHILSFI